MSRRTEPQAGRARKNLMVAGRWGALALTAIVSIGACGDEPPEGSGGAGGAGGAGGVGGGFFCFPGETEPCYTGPVVSEGIGTCRGGERTCDAMGTAFGVCAGQVTPVPDDCATPEDEDCDGAPASACPGAVLAGQRFGGAGDDEGRGVAFDADGSLIAVGTFE